MTDKPIFAHPSAPPSSLCPGLWVSDLCWSERQVRRCQSSSPARRYWTPVYPLLGGAQSTAAKGDTMHLVVTVPSLLPIHTPLMLPGISLQIGACMSASWRVPVVWLLNKRGVGPGDSSSQWKT